MTPQTPNPNPQDKHEQDCPYLYGHNCSCLPAADKQDDKLVSDCHKAPMKLSAGRGDFRDNDVPVTMSYICSECDMPCNIYAPDSPQASETSEHKHYYQNNVCQLCGKLNPSTPTPQSKGKLLYKGKEIKYTGRTSAYITDPPQFYSVEEILKMLQKFANSNVNPGLLDTEIRWAEQQIQALLESECIKAREVFVPVKGAEGHYEVSNTGKVRSVLGGRRKGIELKQGIRNKKGYLSVSLVKGGQVMSASVHRLVASAFLSNPEMKRTVNHKDGNPANNDVSNLEWATHSEQELHAYKMGKLNANDPARLNQLKESKPNA